MTSIPSTKAPRSLLRFAKALQLLLYDADVARVRPVNFYFDNETGLLVRIVRWNDTPVGPVPTQLEYSDYRDVAGIKMPFHWVMTQTYMQATIQLTGIQPNVPIDAARFARPTPVPH